MTNKLLSLNPARWTRRDLPAIWLGLIVIISVLAPILPLQDPLAMNNAARFAAPGSAHLLGQDEYGRDIFSRLVWAMRNSLLVAISAALCPALSERRSAYLPAIRGASPNC